MSLKRRLERLERKQGAGKPLWMERIPWALDDNNEPRGLEIDGRFLTWDEIAARYPDAPRPFMWADEVKP